MLFDFGYALNLSADLTTLTSDQCTELLSDLKAAPFFADNEDAEFWTNLTVKKDLLCAYSVGTQLNTEQLYDAVLPLAVKYQIVFIAAAQYEEDNDWLTTIGD